MLNIGQTITTQKSGIVGKVVEIVATPHSNNFKVRIENEDGERWTTYQVA
jgi:ribosomal protein S4E